MTDVTKMDETTGAVIRLRDSGRDQLELSVQRVLEEDPVVVSLEKKLLTGSELNLDQRQRVEALNAARSVLSTTRTGSFTSALGANGMLQGELPEVLIDVADYIVTGVARATERAEMAMGQSEEEAPNADW